MNSIPQQDRLKTKASPVVARRSPGPDTRFLITAGIAGGLGIIAIFAIVMLFHRLPERMIAPAAAPAPAATPAAKPVAPAAPMMVSAGTPVEVIASPTAVIGATPTGPRTTRVKRSDIVAFRGTVSPARDEVQSAKGDAADEVAEKADTAAAGTDEVKEAAAVAPEPKESAAEEPSEIRQAGKIKRVLGSLLHPFQRRKPAAEQ